MTSANYAVAPGAYLREWMQEHGLSREDVAAVLGWQPQRVDAFINGNAPVTPEVAIGLERVMGISADSWRRYEAAYRSDVERLGR